MTLEDACRSVLGTRAADAIIADQGLHWCFVVAVAAAQKDHPKNAIAALKARLDEIRRERNEPPQLVACNQCGGSGFDTRGTGYDNVCGKCGGQKLLPIALQ